MMVVITVAKQGTACLLAAATAFYWWKSKTSRERRQRTLKTWIVEKTLTSLLTTTQAPCLEWGCRPEENPTRFFLAFF